MAKKSKFSDRVNKYYENKKKDYAKLIDMGKSYDSKTYKKNDKHIIELKHGGKLIFKAEYQLLGFYNIINSSWYWGYASELSDRSLIQTSISMKSFGEYIKKNLDDFEPVQADDLYFKTSTNSFFSNLDNISQLVKTSMYNLKKDWFITLCHGRNGKVNSCDPNLNKNKSKSNNMRFEYLLINKVLSIG
jgi:hypothetical protein